ncbi:MAG: urea ABC transporter substrate-binding protein, partial [Moraxellaceae bacterium]
MLAKTAKSFSWKTCLFTLAASFAFSTAYAADVNTTGLAVTDKTVKVGILHSVTGTMA